MLPWREHPAASTELLDAVEWYEERQPGLGESLKSELMEHLHFVRDDVVVVVAYAHERRRPGYWRERLQDL